MNKYYKRILLDILKKLVDRREIFAIKGPRQSGKTTLLKIITDYLIEEHGVKPFSIIYLTFEDREILDKFSKSPVDYVKSFMAAENERYYFLIDEFQYLKGGGQKLKLLYDQLENIKFIITGSSSLELASKTGKYLVGRLFSFYLYQFNFPEFANTRSEQLFRAVKEKKQLIKEFILNGINFSIDRDIFLSDLNKLYEDYTLWGGYPEVVKTSDPETKRMILKNIYDTYLSRDIVELLKISHTSKFRSLVILLANQIGNLINYNNLAADIQSYFKEIKHYLSILEETYLISLPRPFHKNKTTELKKNPKIYFTDIGLRNYILNNFNSIALRPDRGEIIENSVFTALKIDYPDIEIKYWRTLAGAEVDFVLQAGKDIIPLEAKYSSFEKPKISRGFRNFIQEYRPHRACVVTRDFLGEMKLDGTLIKFIPVFYL